MKRPMIPPRGERQGEGVAPSVSTTIPDGISPLFPGGMLGRGTDMAITRQVITSLQRDGTDMLGTKSLAVKIADRDRYDAL